MHVPSTAVLLSLLLAPAASLTAQGRVLPSDPACERDWEGDRDRAWFCEVREFTLSPRSTVAVDASPNGGIGVEGVAESQIRLRAIVTAWARSDEAAQSLARAVRVLTDGETVRAEGPRTDRRESWSVTYELAVPSRSNLRLSTVNGGIRITNVTGRIDFRTTNGGVHLTRLAGDVRGRTTNGGVQVELAGSEWSGQGLDVETTNGRVQLDVPADYSARLETGTTNGSLRVDFPITVQGRIDRRISADLGRGGRTIRVTTTNGGVVIRRM